MRTIGRLVVVVVTALAFVAGTAAAASARPGVGNLGPGDTGAGVRCVQFAYNVLAGRGLATDGIYGSATTTATRDWQRFFGLSVDGVVGPVTGESIQDIWDFRRGAGSWKNQWVTWQGVSVRCWGVVPSQT
jgi:peptidoglycan hydrolase-like protein with peptidoglycan-binding domain